MRGDTLGFCIKAMPCPDIRTGHRSAEAATCSGGWHNIVRASAAGRVACLAGEQLLPAAAGPSRPAGHKASEMLRRAGPSVSATQWPR